MNEDQNQNVMIGRVAGPFAGPEINDFLICAKQLYKLSTEREGAKDFTCNAWVGINPSNGKRYYTDGVVLMIEPGALDGTDVWDFKLVTRRKVSWSELVKAWHYATELGKQLQLRVRDGSWNFGTSNLDRATEVRVPDAVYGILADFERVKMGAVEVAFSAKGIEVIKFGARCESGWSSLVWDIPNESEISVERKIRIDGGLLYALQPKSILFDDNFFSVCKFCDCFPFPVDVTVIPLGDPWELMDEAVRSKDMEEVNDYTVR